MKLKSFIVTFALVYVLLSLPVIFGVGYVIDWVPEASFFQKFKGYIVEGLLNNFLIKTVVACIVGTIISLILPKRQQ